MVGKIIVVKELRWEWCLEKGMWYATYTEDKIISLTGIHPKDGYRALYRGAPSQDRERTKQVSKCKVGVYMHIVTDRICKR